MNKKIPGNYYMQRMADLRLNVSAESMATLALAYEQRTANLIAVATAVSDNGSHKLDPALISDAQNQLRERLGMDDD